MRTLKRVNVSRLTFSRRIKVGGCQIVYRRLASTGHDHGHEQGHNEAHASSEESLGKGFYITLAAIPLSLAVYKFSRSGGDNDKPYLTRLIDSYKSYERRWEERNALHTQAVEAAARDKNLFYSSPRSPTIDLRFPETFSTGSPYNVPAGHGGGNIDQLIAHYAQKNRDNEEATRRAMESREQRSQ